MMSLQPQCQSARCNPPLPPQREGAKTTRGDFYMYVPGYQWEQTTTSFILFLKNLLKKKKRNFKAADPTISEIADLCVCKQMKKPTRLAYDWKPHGRSHRDDHGVMQQVHRTLLLEVALQSIQTENQSNELHYIMKTSNPWCTAPPTKRKALKDANLPNHTSCSSHNASQQQLPNKTK